MMASLQNRFAAAAASLERKYKLELQALLEAEHETVSSGDASKVPNYWVLRWQAEQKLSSARKFKLALEEMKDEIASMERSER